uniref:Uncharacterized protein n=1 Tax=Tanacetum cinerariifolium TaxID=118510 RepID=A0A6L2LVB7_TANCI|nr:hypothetical protein [Tanacetum cinerariifolium]
MTWHATGKCTEPGKMQHPVDGRAWKNFDTKYPNFAKEPRNVQLGLAADGFNPFCNLSQSYSMWSVILTTYNLPMWLYMKENSFMLMLLIPVSKSPGKNIDVYLRPLIDDLKDLWAKPGVETIDVATGQKFNMKAMVLWTINDFPTRSSLSGWSGQEIYSQNLMKDDMLKGQSKALEGGPIRPWWMYSFERFMKKLKNYVRNKAKMEGSIGEGYVAEEALTFSFHYFWDVTVKFNRPDRNVDFPPPTLIWHVLHNSPEIDTYRVKFKSQFPNKDMKEEFPGWFGSEICQCHVDKDPGVSASNELFALACGPTPTLISVNYCVVNSVRFVVHSRGKRHITQNSDICSPSEDEEMYYVQIEEILEFSPVEDDPDIIHVDNYSDLTLTTSLNDLEIAVLHIDGQSIDVDAPLDIIDVDEDDDIFNDEDVLPHDLASSDDEDLVNVDDDDDVAFVYSIDVARGHGGDCDSDDRPPPRQLAGGCRGKGTRKPNLRGRKAGMMHIRKETRNLKLRKIMDELGPEFLMRFGSWRRISPERKARVLKKIRKPSYPDVPRTSLRKIGMSRSGFGLILRTWPDAELRDSRVAVPNPNLLRYTYCWRRILAGRGLTFICTYTDDQIMAMVRGGKQRGHIFGVGRVLAGRGKDVLNVPVPRCNHTFNVNELKRSNKQLQKQIDMITKAMSNDDKISTQLQS